MEPIYSVQYPEGERSTLTIEVTLCGTSLLAQAWLDTPDWDRTKWSMSTERMLAALAEAHKKLSTVPESVNCVDCNGVGSGEGFICGPGRDRYGTIICVRCKRTGQMPLVEIGTYQRGRELHAKRIERHESMRAMCERLSIPGLSMVELSKIERGQWEGIEQRLIDAVFQGVE